MPNVLTTDKHAPLPLPSSKQKDGDSRFSGDIAALGGLRGAFGAGSTLSVERYNEALPQYYARYGDYASQMAKWLELIRLSATIVLELHNNGSATATDVDVTLHFPEGIVLWSIIDIDGLAELVAHILVGRGFHAALILQGVRLDEGPITVDIKGKLFTELHPDNEPRSHHRDGVLFEVICWVAAKLSAGANEALTDPHLKATYTNLL